MPQQRDPNSKKAAAFSARQKIMEQQIPIPSPSLSPSPSLPPKKNFKDEALRNPKHAIFLSLIWSGGGPLNFPFILPKIVVSPCW